MLHFFIILKGILIDMYDPNPKPVSVVDHERYLQQLSKYLKLTNCRNGVDVKALKGMANTQGPKRYLTLAPDTMFCNLEDLAFSYYRVKLNRAYEIEYALDKLHEYFKEGYFPVYFTQLCTIKELYNDLIELGYDWDLLLNTRGYLLYPNDPINNEVDDLPYLDIHELLNIRKGLADYPLFKKVVRHA